MTDASATRRDGVIAVSWGPFGSGDLTLDGMHWATVEWSEKRQAWCIEDVEGRCLRHQASIHGKAASRDEAVALAEAMVRDGRMPDPETAQAQAKERRRLAREKRARRPSEIKRRAQRKAERAALEQHIVAQCRERMAQPFYELFAETFDLADPDLWKSNSFAAFRPRLIVEAEAAIAELEFSRWLPNRDARLDRARAILSALKRSEQGEPAP